MLFTDENVISLGKDLVADGTAEVKTAVLDMAGFDEATFIVDLGDVDAAAVMTFTVKENTANSTTSPTPTVVDLDSVSAGALTAGALVATEDTGNLDDKLIVLNVKRAAMTQRYLFLSITATVESFVIDSNNAIQSVARDVPVDQSSDVYAVGKGYA